MKKLNTYRVWGYANNSATKESCTIEVKAYTKKEALARLQEKEVILTSKVYKA
jgi:hypothetical protein